MPQLTKGGKFVFGVSIINENLTLQFPMQAISEYSITKEDKIIIFTGSKKTGGFCVTSKNLLSTSKLQHILTDCPTLANYELPEGEFIRYKDRGYAWISITKTGNITFKLDTLKYLDLHVNDTLMSIRSSDIAFTMGVKGPLVEKLHNYQGDIEKY